MCQVQCHKSYRLRKHILYHSNLEYLVDPRFRVPESSANDSPTPLDMTGNLAVSSCLSNDRTISSNGGLSSGWSLQHDVIISRYCCGQLLGIVGRVPLKIETFQKKFTMISQPSILLASSPWTSSLV